MEVKTFENAYDFLAETEEYLEYEEACNNLMLGIAYSLKDNLMKYGNKPFFAVVKHQDQIQLSACMTPPYKLVLYSSLNNCEAACDLLIKKLNRIGLHVPGIIGPNNTADAFKYEWEKVHHVNVNLSMAMRVYTLTKVEKVTRPNGHFRIANKTDAPIIQEWIDLFYEEVFTNNKNVIKNNALSSINEGNLFVWDDNGLVAMVDRRRPTRNGYVIGLAYTPENQRNKGYATANVAEICQLVLDSGKKFCSLFTDLSNPISNSIYQKIGFKPVCDYYDYSFGQ